MHEPPAELARRGRRVAGMFAFMIGAGMLLESASLAAGTGLTLGGLGLFLASFLAPLRASPASETEGRVEALGSSPAAHGADEVVRRDRGVLAEEGREKP